jgi:hypothetical protein
LLRTRRVCAEARPAAASRSSIGVERMGLW